MRKVVTRVLVLVSVCLFVSASFATPLDSHKNEWAFDFHYTDTDNAGKFTNLNFSWQWIFAKGRHELGALTTYFKDDPDVGASTDGMTIGPVYTFNFTPASSWGTGYFDASYSTTSGDLSDAFDSVVEAAVGAKFFVGNSAAVKAEFFWQSLAGASGFNDVDSTGINVGISIFSH
jgi:hypothetical protein